LARASPTNASASSNAVMRLLSSKRRASSRVSWPVAQPISTTRAPAVGRDAPQQQRRERAA
jgi:hypothetical protein